jgi:hypothetical protein
MTESILNYVVRMVVPMRREFGRSLDVQQFMRDSGYAHSVLEEALGSADERLRDYAAYVKRHMAGAREARPPSVPPGAYGAHGANGAAAAATAPAPAAPNGAAHEGETLPGADAPPAGKPAQEPTEAELRAKMMRKYTGGLR